MNSSEHSHNGTRLALACWVGAAAVLFAADHFLPGLVLLESGLTLLQLLGVFAILLAAAEGLGLLTHFVLLYRGKPAVEGAMIRRIYRLVAVLSVAMAGAYGLGALATFGTFFSLFGGMLLGWSLQAPVSGVAAWILVSLKRPFRPGDRIQFPSLGLTGDVQNTGPMYTVLNQVGGTIGSEEAVGRHVLVPNAMLFSQVVINYTVMQDSPYMLDEVIVRITFDSNWENAESILLEAAREATGDIIVLTGVEPYIRSDLYDYGVYLRLRYQTRVKDRAEISYRINRKIFERVQRVSSVDLAIPYVYSFKKGAEGKDADAMLRDDWPLPVSNPDEVRLLEMDQIRCTVEADDSGEIEATARSMSPQWLHRPIVVRRGQDGLFDIVAGHLQYSVCQFLEWNTISAIVLEGKATDGAATPTAVPTPGVAAGLAPR